MQLCNQQADKNQWLPWQREAFTAFAANMMNPSRPFPCISVVQAYALGDLRYGFAGDPCNIAAAEELAALLAEFAETSRQAGTYPVLVVFFDTPPELAEGYTVRQFEQLFWQLLSRTSAFDAGGWPADVPLDAHDPLWELC
ncbi:YqcI/YcgG family protein [Geobacillus subterraneus]|uniref:YqcI/YcgG family protein n=1 Tax=Geobacillus subterraneus TaxID=129338 RepID=UPI001442D137|nr:YqcI/YcgG family protein [Geobacillus subterraneus]QIZ68013.1 hypothetical protein HF500_12785 [Geobacillus subterraneus]